MPELSALRLPPRPLSAQTGRGRGHTQLLSRQAMVLGSGSHQPNKVTTPMAHSAATCRGQPTSCGLQPSPAIQPPPTRGRLAVAALGLGAALLGAAHLRAGMGGDGDSLWDTAEQAPLAACHAGAPQTLLSSSTAGTFREASGWSSPAPHRPRSPSQSGGSASRTAATAPAGGAVVGRVGRG